MIHNHKQVQNDVNTVISKHIKTQKTKSAAMHNDYGFLWQSISELYQAGGKRLRPYLLVLAYEAYGGEKYQDILPVAASVELLHSAMLIHDDVIDRDYVRHGKKNIAGMYLQRYGKLKNNQAEKSHAANSAAIMAGDLLLSDAYQLIINSKITQSNKSDAIQLLGEAIYTTIGGQLLDTEAATFSAGNVDSLLVAKYKTSYYSFALPLLLGSMLAGATEDSKNDLISIGTALGICFQLLDDFRGIFNDSGQTGKPAFGDLREGKNTYLLQTTLELASQGQKKVLNSVIGNPNCDNKMSQTVQRIMTETGAKTSVEKKIQEYLEQAISRIEKLSINENHKKLLIDFAEQVAVK